MNLTAQQSICKKVVSTDWDSDPHENPIDQSVDKVVGQVHL